LLQSETDGPFAAPRRCFFVKLSRMDTKKASENLDVGGEEFQEILQFLQEGTEAPLPPSTSENAEWETLKKLLTIPPRNRRALREYLAQSSHPHTGDKIKKAA